jgi:hypothetical protein
MPRHYSPLSGRKVERAMQEMKQGELRSGRSGKKVTSRKQAIAIGLSEARQAGARVPKRRTKSRTKSRTH